MPVSPASLVPADFTHQGCQEKRRKDQTNRLIFILDLADVIEGFSLTARLDRYAQSAMAAAGADADQFGHLAQQPGQVLGVDRDLGSFRLVSALGFSVA